MIYDKFVDYNGRFFHFTGKDKEPIKTDYHFGKGARIISQVVCDPSEAKIGMRVKSTFRRIATDGERGIIHYGTKFMPE
jgi:hypothetical protein